MVDTDDTRRTMDDGRRTTPGVWHKLPTGELKNYYYHIYLSILSLFYIQHTTGVREYLSYRTYTQLKVIAVCTLNVSMFSKKHHSDTETCFIFLSELFDQP